MEVRAEGKGKKSGYGKRDGRAREGRHGRKKSWG